MPRRMRVAVDAVSIRRPSNVIVPDRAGTRPEMVFTSVDLPAPLAPTRVTISPGRPGPRPQMVFPSGGLPGRLAPKGGDDLPRLPREIDAADHVDAAVASRD